MAKDAIRQLPNLLACPYCNELPVYAYGDNQANAIYCTYCPLGVETMDMTLEQLAKIWNELPRNPDRRIGGTL